MSYSLDVESFISEVKKYPAIWDLNSGEYKQRKAKEEALAQVARVFLPDYDELNESEQEEVYKRFFMKWRTIRDSYCRHTKNTNKRSGYMYAKHLTFLDKNYERRSYGTNNNRSQDEECDDQSDKEKKVQKLKKIGFMKSGTKDRQYLEIDDSWQCDEAAASTSKKQIKSAKPMAEPSIEYVDAHNILPEPTTSYPVDEDRSFFESLLPAIRDFDIDKKLEFRCEVLKLLKCMRSKDYNERKRMKRDPIDDDDEDFS